MTQENESIKRGREKELDMSTLEREKDKDLNSGWHWFQINNDNDEIDKSERHENAKDETNKENEENERREGNSSDNNQKKRDRDEEVGNSPKRKRVGDSPKKKRGRKIKLIKGKNYHQKYMKAKKCKDCKRNDEMKCKFCGKNEHICEIEIKNVENKEHAWICKDCNEIINDEGVMEEIMEIIKRERECKGIDKIGETKTYCCGLCSDVINGKQISIGCNECKAWIHLKCSIFNNYKEAKKNEDEYVCTKCKNRNDPSKKEIPNTDLSKHGEQTTIEESDLETLNEGNWLNDNIIKSVNNIMQRKYKNMLFVDPSVTQLIKLSNDKSDIEKNIEDLEIKKVDWVFFPLNNNHTDKEGGSHWSLLLYNQKEDTFYHFDPICGLNDKSVAMLIKNLNDSEKRIPEVRYVNCPRQRNGVDCGPYTLYFAEKIAENIDAGREITKIRDCDAREYRLKLKEMIRGKPNTKEDEVKEDENKVKMTEKEKVSHEKDKGENRNEKKEESKRECYYYTNNTCKFGNTCIYDHIDSCKEVVDNGYCFDKKCRFGHPRVCRMIYKTGSCKRNMCKFFHPLNLRNKNRRRETNESYEFNEIYSRHNRENNPYPRKEGNSRRSSQIEYDHWEASRDHSDKHFLVKQDRYLIERLEPMMERILSKMTEKMCRK